jgi:hypothetical protein
VSDGRGYPTLCRVFCGPLHATSRRAFAGCALLRDALDRQTIPDHDRIRFRQPSGCAQALHQAGSALGANHPGALRDRQSRPGGRPWHCVTASPGSFLLGAFGLALRSTGIPAPHDQSLATGGRAPVWSPLTEPFSLPISAPHFTTDYCKRQVIDFIGPAFFCETSKFCKESYPRKS